MKSKKNKKKAKGKKAEFSRRKSSTSYQSKNSLKESNTSILKGSNESIANSSLSSKKSIFNADSSPSITSLNITVDDPLVLRLLPKKKTKASISLSILENPKALEQILAKKLHKINKLDDRNKMAPLHYAAMFATKDTMQKLIDLSGDRLDFNLVDGNARTPLIHACLSNQLDLINLLLQKSEVTVDNVDKFGYTCIHYCIAIDNLEALQTLFPKSSNPNRLYNGESYLHCALRLNKPDLAMTLIEKGADIHLKDSQDKTPLHLACELELESLCKHLLSRGADPRQADSDGKYPADYLSANENLIDLLQIQNESEVKEDEIQEDSSPTISLLDFAAEKTESEEVNETQVEVGQHERCEVKKANDAPLGSLETHEDHTEESIAEDISSIEEDLPLPEDEDEDSNEVLKGMKNIVLHPVPNAIGFSTFTSKVPVSAREMPSASPLSSKLEEMHSKENVIKNEEKLNVVTEINEKDRFELKKKEMDESKDIHVSTVKQESSSNAKPHPLLCKNEPFSKPQLVSNEELDHFQAEESSIQETTSKVNENINLSSHFNGESLLKQSDSVNRSGNHIPSMTPLSSNSRVQPMADPSSKFETTEPLNMGMAPTEDNVHLHNESGNQELNVRPFKPRLEPIRLQPLSSTPPTFASKPSIFLAPLRGPRPSSMEKKMVPGLNTTSIPTPLSDSMPLEIKSHDEPIPRLLASDKSSADEPKTMEPKALYENESFPSTKLSNSESINGTNQSNSLVIKSTEINEPVKPSSITPLDSAISPEHQPLEWPRSKEVSSKVDESEAWDIIEEIEMEDENEEGEEQDEEGEEQEKDEYSGENKENEVEDEKEVEVDEEQDEDEDDEEEDVEDVDNDDDDGNEGENEDENDEEEEEHDENEEYEERKEDEMIGQKGHEENGPLIFNSNAKASLSEPETIMEQPLNPTDGSILVFQEKTEPSFLNPPSNPFPVPMLGLPFTQVKSLVSESPATTIPESLLDEEVDNVSTPRKKVEPSHNELKEEIDAIPKEMMQEMEIQMEVQEEAVTPHSSNLFSGTPQTNLRTLNLEEDQEDTESSHCNVKKDAEGVKERVGEERKEGLMLKTDEINENSGCLEMDMERTLSPLLKDKFLMQETTIRTLQHQLNDTQHQCQVLEAQLKKEQQSNKDYESTLKKVEETSQGLLQLAETRFIELQNLQAQLNCNQKDTEAFRGQLAYTTKLQAELQSLSSKYESLEMEFHDLQQRYKETELNHDSKTVELHQGFEAEKRTLESLVNDLKFKVQDLESQHEQDQQEMGQFKEEISSWKEQKELNESKVNQLTSEHTRLTTMYEQLMVEYQQKDQKFKEHQLNATQLRTDYANLESEKKLLHIEHTELQMKYQQLETEFQMVQETYQQVHFQLQEMKQSHLEKETNLQQVTSEYELKLQQLQSQVERVSQLEAVYEGVKQECETHLTTLTTEKETQRQMELKFKTLESSMKVKEDQLRQSENQLKNVQQELIQTKQQFNEITMQLDQALENAKQMESLHSSVKKTADLYYLKLEQLNAGKQEQEDSYHQLQRQVQVLEGKLMQEKQLTTKFQSEFQVLKTKLDEHDLQASNEASEFHARELDLTQQCKLLKIEYEAKLKDVSQLEKKLEEQCSVNRQLQKELDSVQSMKMVQSHHQWQEMQARYHRSQLQITQLEGQVETLQLKLALKEDLVKDALAQETELKEHHQQLRLQLKHMEDHLLDTQTQFLDQCRATREAEEAKAGLKTKLQFENQAVYPSHPSSYPHPRVFNTTHTTTTQSAMGKVSNFPPTSPTSPVSSSLPLPLATGLSKFDSPLFPTHVIKENPSHSTEKAIMDKLTSLETKIKKLAFSSTPSTNFNSSFKPFTFSSTLPSSLQHSIPIPHQPPTSHFSLTKPIPTARGLAETISKLKRQNMILDAKLMGLTKSNANNLAN